MEKELYFIPRLEVINGIPCSEGQIEELQELCREHDLHPELLWSDVLGKLWIKPDLGFLLEDFPWPIREWIAYRLCYGGQQYVAWNLLQFSNDHHCNVQREGRIYCSGLIAWSDADGGWSLTPDVFAPITEQS